MSGKREFVSLAFSAYEFQFHSEKTNMSMFIQSLESRTFLSVSPVTKATLIADQANIVADAAAANATLKTLVAELKTNTGAIATDLKTLPKSNAPLLKMLKDDEAKTEKTLTTDLGLLVKPGLALVKKSTIVGELLLIKATVKALAIESADIAALGSVTTTPLANLTAALGGTTVDADLNAFVTANSGAASLAADAAMATGNISTQEAAISTAAAQFATDIATLASDLSSVHTAVGTFPNMVGTLNGTAVVTKGKDVGTTSDITVVIASEDANGNLVGTVTDTSNNDVHSLTATISLNGKFTGKLIGGQSGTEVILGQFSTGILSGTYKASNHSGTFSVVEAG